MRGERRGDRGEVRQSRGKLNILHYPRGSPLHLKSSALCAFRDGTHDYDMRHRVPRETAHARTNTQAHKKKGRRNKVWCAFECIFIPALFRSVSPSVAGNSEIEATIRVWYDTLLRPLSHTAPANMQAHLRRALKPSLVLWRPKHSNFFQQTSSQRALDCQWGSPNSKIYHLETHKSPLRQIFSFKASPPPQKKERERGRKAQSRNV